MRLNCALVSSLLFISAVLAEEPDSYAVAVTKLSADNDFAIVNQVGAVIEIPPKIGGPAGSGFTIGIGIDGFNCQSGSASAGVTVYKTNDVNGVHIGAWAVFLPYFQTWAEEEKVFRIEPGDKLIIEMTTGSSLGVPGLQHVGVVFKDPKTEAVLWNFVATANVVNHQLCGKTAHWGVTLAKRYGDQGGFRPLANFKKVNLRKVKYMNFGTLKFPNAATAKIFDIKTNGQDETLTQVLSGQGSTKRVVVTKLPLHT